MHRHHGNLRWRRRPAHRRVTSLKSRRLATVCGDDSFRSRKSHRASFYPWITRSRFQHRPPDICPRQGLVQPMHRPSRFQAINAFPAGLRQRLRNRPPTSSLSRRAGTGSDNGESTRLFDQMPRLTGLEARRRYDVWWLASKPPSPTLPPHHMARLKSVWCSGAAVASG